MSYTIRINDLNSELAKQLVWYLKSLSSTKEYDFLQIIEDKESSTLTAEQKQELDKRYEHFLQHHEEYPDWEDVKSKYIKK